jgi:hypothetical protein
MKFALYTFVAALAVAISAEPVMAYGRGAAVRGARVGPAGGVRTGGAARGVSTGPFGGVHAGNVHGGTYRGPGGTTVQHVGGAGVSRGPLGGVHAGAGGATRVTGPGGNTVARGGGIGGGVGPLGGTRVGAVGGSAVRTPYGGGAAVGARGGIGVGPYGGVHAGAARGGFAVGPGSIFAGGVRYGAVGHRTAYMSPTVVRGAAYGVRAARYPYFTPTWYRAHANTWIAPRWVAGYNLWRPVAWTPVATFVGITAPPVVYDYGSTVVIQNDYVYVNGDQVGTAANYAAQADQIADAGRQAKPAQTDEWQPLGVFGMIEEDEKVAQRIFQLAVNKDGVVRGNYYDSVADSTLPVVGSVDKKTQRVAWSIGDKKDIVFETGLANFTKEESTVLVHHGKENTQQMILVRLEEPKDGK